MKGHTYMGLNIVNREGGPDAKLPLVLIRGAHELLFWDHSF